jgi:hypothetical protein
VTMDEKGLQGAAGGWGLGAGLGGSIGETRTFDVWDMIGFVGRWLMGLGNYAEHPRKPCP